MVLRALHAYPDQTILALDMDCSVLGELDGDMAAVTVGDVHLNMMTRSHRKGWRCWYSTRVGLWRPTPGAHMLAAYWAQECADQRRELAPLCDERALAFAIAETPGILISSLPSYLAGLDKAAAPSTALIVHDSAHDAARPMIVLKRKVKAWRRRLFRGRHNRRGGVESQQNTG